MDVDRMNTLKLAETKSQLWKDTQASIPLGVAQSRETGATTLPASSLVSVIQSLEVEACQDHTTLFTVFAFINF